MTRAGVLVAFVVLLALVVTMPGGAKTSASPFYLIPSVTKECRNVPACVAVTGPWVVVPPHAEATFLLRCPLPTGYVIGGTDARASSSDVRVSYDGQLGAPIGTPPKQSSGGAELLFHAVTNTGRAGSFQPILGCVTLKQKSPRSVLSASTAHAVPGRAPGQPLDYRSRLIPLQPGGFQRAAIRQERCLPHEQLVGTWTALAFFNVPPNLTKLGTLTVARVVSGNHVTAVLPTQISLFAQGAFPEVQVGAMCQA